MKKFKKSLYLVGNTVSKIIFPLKHLSKRNQKIAIGTSLVIILIMIPVIFYTLIHLSSAHATTDTLTGSGTWTVPAGVTSVTVEAYGGGEGALTLGRGGFIGGYGGDYATSTVSVTPGNNIAYSAGTGGGMGITGGDSDWNSGQVLAAGGGTGSSDVGTTTHTGGVGEPNGGGGGAAGPGGNGGDGSGGLGGAGGGGYAGNGGDFPDNDGITYGGGGAADVGIGADGVIILTYTAPPPTKVVFTNSSRTLTAGACNGAGSVFTMQLQDSGGTPTNPTGSTVINVSSNSSGTVTFYSDSSCTTTVSGGNFTFTTSDNTMSVYMKDTRKSASTWTLTAHKTSGPDTITDGTQTYTVNAGSVTRLVVTLPGQTFTDGTGNSGSVTGQTAGVSFTIAKISATDDYFNLNTGYSGAKTLAYSGPANAPNGQSPGYTTSVSFTSGQSTTTLTTTLYKAESPTITVTDSGSYGYASSSVTVSSGSISADVSDSTVTGSASTTQNTPITVTITLYDTWENPKVGIVSSHITLVSTGGSFTQPSSNTDSNGQTTGSVQWASLGSKTVQVQITTDTLVQNNGTSADVDGYLDNTLGVTVANPGSSERLKGNLRLEGNVRLK